MSQSATKASRRALRRAFGDQAIAVVDQQAAAIAQFTDVCREAFALQNATITALAARVAALEARDHLETTA